VVIAIVTHQCGSVPANIDPGAGAAVMPPQEASIGEEESS